MMKSVLLAVCLCFVAAEAQAISRYDPTRMSCDEVRAVVNREGAAILRYRSTRTPGLSLYDRYVRNNRFCERGEVRKRAFVPSADLNACPVFKCVRPEFDRRFRRLFPD